MLALKDSEEFPDFDAEGKLNLLLSRSRKIFHKPELEKVQLDNKVQCEIFISDIRDEVCKMHEDLFEVSREMMGRMTLIERLEAQIVEQRDQYLKIIDV